MPRWMRWRAMLASKSIDDFLQEERIVLTQLQRGLSLVEAPYKEVGANVGWQEQQVLEFIRKLRTSGIIRRIGGVFDARRIGYQSVLCAVEAPSDQLATLASRIDSISGITHVYERRAVGQTLNFWFTLVEESCRFKKVASDVSRLLAPYTVNFLPASRRFKIDVMFDLGTRDRDERCPAISSESVVEYRLDDREREIIRLLDGDLPDEVNPFAYVARMADLSVNELLQKLAIWRDEGVLRRVGALLYHRRAGFLGNGMCCWFVPSDEELLSKGRALATSPEVSHCYSRTMTQVVQFNLYAMVHAQTPEQALDVARNLGQQSGLGHPVVFLSTQEFKKTSMRFFR